LQGETPAKKAGFGLEVEGWIDLIELASKNKYYVEGRGNQEIADTWAKSQQVEVF